MNGTAPSFGSAWWGGDIEALPVVEHERAAQDLLVIPNFLDVEQCAAVRGAFDASIAALAPHATDPFWDERLLWFDQIAKDQRRAKAIMQQARFVIAYRLAERFGRDRRLYSDSQQLVLWREGQGMQVHVDNAHPDGSAHGTPHRDYAAVLYLNDQFDGGEIAFPLLGYRVKPSAGLLVGFPGSSSCPHGVTRVRSGLRYTMPCWYSFDPAVAESTMFDIF